MVNIRPDEISSIIRQQIDKYDQGVQSSEFMTNIYNNIKNLNVSKCDFD